MTNKTINTLSTLTGFVVIFTSMVSLFILDKVNWPDVLAAIAAGIGLIYTKNNRITKTAESMIHKKTQR